MEDGGTTEAGDSPTAEFDFEGFLESLGPAAKERRRPTAKGTLVAAGGALVWLGLIAFSFDSYSDEGSATAGVILSLLAVGAGYLLVEKQPVGLRSAGLALAALGTVSTVGFLFDDLDSPWAAFLVAAIAYLVQWSKGPLRGEATMLAFGLWATWALIIDAVESEPDPFDSSGPVFAPVDVPDSGLFGGDTAAAYISLVIGAGLLFAMKWLDANGWKGVGTGAVIVGNIAYFVGVLGTVGQVGSDGFAAFLVIVACGLAAAWAAPGGRRFTTWLGGLGMFVGLIAFLFAVFEPESASSFGTGALVLGAIVVAGAMAHEHGYLTKEGLAAAQASMADGGDDAASAPDAAPPANKEE